MSSNSTRSPGFQGSFHQGTRDRDFRDFQKNPHNQSPGSLGVGGFNPNEKVPKSNPNYGCNLQAPCTSDMIEVLPGRLFWKGEPRTSRPSMTWSEQNYHNPNGNYNFKLLNHSGEKGYRFETDLDICYQSFARDFGPLNIAVIWRYCRLIEQVMEMPNTGSRRVIHQTNSSESLRKTNSVFLICAYCVVMEGIPAKQVYEPFRKIEHTFVPFCDASSCQSLFDLDILTCLEGLEAACKLGWFKYRTLDADWYENREKVENGDLNWIIDNKIMAFATPQTKTKDLEGFPVWTPEMYIPLFKKWKIGTVVRLNKPSAYRRETFIEHGINHVDLYFNDGATPPDDIMRQFLKIVENEPNGIAVHCKAGLGRTGTLIGGWAMKHFKIPAKMFIAWNRLARPGSILGPQQKYLVDLETEMISHQSAHPVMIDYEKYRNTGEIKVCTNNQYDEINGTANSSGKNANKLKKPTLKEIMTTKLSVGGKPTDAGMTYNSCGIKEATDQGCGFVYDAQWGRGTASSRMLCAFNIEQRNEKNKAMSMTSANGVIIHHMNNDGMMMNAAMTATRNKSPIHDRYDSRLRNSNAYEEDSITNTTSRSNVFEERYVGGDTENRNANCSNDRGDRDRGDRDRCDRDRDDRSPVNTPTTTTCNRSSNKVAGLKRSYIGMGGESNSPNPKRLEQKNQGDFLVNQKRKAQGHKTQNVDAPGAYTSI